MSQFECIGGDCEDSCCASWGVEVSEDTAAAIEAALGTPAMRRLISFYTKEYRTDERCGRLRMPAYKTCSMLDKQGMCALQQEHGEALLPTTCSSYPRSHSIHGAAHVLGGFLSCPEVARQALLTDSGLTLQDVPLPRRRMNIDQRVDKSGAYFDLREEVSAMLASFACEHSMAERLWLLARLVSSTVACFNRTTTDPQPIRGLLASADSPHLQARWLSQLPDQPRPIFDEEFVGALKILAVDCGIYIKPRSHVARALAVVEAEGLDAGRARWREQEPVLAAALDRYLRFHLLSRWYTDSPDLSSHFERVLLKMAVVRLLVRTAPPTSDLHDVFIQAVYGVDRMVEHDAWFFQARARIERISGGHMAQLADWVRF